MAGQRIAVHGDAIDGAFAGENGELGGRNDGDHPVTGQPRVIFHPSTLSGECTVYGIVAGNVLVTSQAVVLGDEKITHDGLDQLVVTECGRSIRSLPSVPRQARPAQEGESMIFPSPNSRHSS